MSTSPLSLLNNHYQQSILNTALQGTGLSSSATKSTSATSTQSEDNGQLSPFAQLMSTLQQLQESNPTEYKQVTQQIATNLQNAAQSATQDGNSGAATQLNQLATDFNNASQSGQLPNIADLAQAVGGGNHHHHGHHAAASDSSTDSSTDSSNSTSSSPLDQLLSAFQSNATQNDSSNPMSIIMNTLTSAGITTSNS